MHYILLKGSNDQSRVAVSQELKRLRKRVKELEEEIEEVKGQYDYECECNKQFVACQKENAELKNQQNKTAIQELERIAKKLKVVPKFFEAYNVGAPILKTYFIIDNGVKENKQGRKIIKAGSPLLKTENFEKDKLLVGSSSDKIFGNPDVVGFTRYDIDVSDGKVVAACRCMDYADKISLFIDYVNNRLEKLKGENNENI